MCKAPRSVALLTAIGGLFWPAASHADVAFNYGSVVCQGSQALVRFVMAYNFDRPDFSMTPGILGGDLRKLNPVDPGRCVLADGREVILKEAVYVQSQDHGFCGGDESLLFSLWIGGKKLYGPEISHDKCDTPFSVVSIFYDGRSLFECQVEQQWPRPPRVLTCRDDSARLSHPLPETTDGGSFKLIRFAAGREDFCRSLPQPSVPTVRKPEYPFDTWPTLVSWPGVRWSSGGAHKQFIDLDNNGVVDLAVPVTPRTGPYLDILWWMALPIDSTPEEIAKAEELFQSGSLSALRDAKIPVFTGEGIANSDYPAIGPFRVNGMTYFHVTRFVNSLTQPHDVIVRFNPAGGFDEICAWMAIPPL